MDEANSKPRASSPLDVGRRSLLLASALMVSGCAFSPVNMGATSTSDGAIVFGMVRQFSEDGVNLHDSISIVEVDGNHVAYSGSTPDSQAIALAQGVHQISVEYKLLRLRQKLPHHAVLKVPAAVSLGKQYKLDGRVDGAWVEVWLVDAATGQRMSEVQRAIHVPKLPDPIKMPIIVPVRAR